MYTIPELLIILTTIQYNDRIFFKDENYNQWYVQVEENWDDDDEKYFPWARIQHWDNCYLYAQASGESIPEAIMYCLHELDLIPAGETANV